MGKSTLRGILGADLSGFICSEIVFENATNKLGVLFIRFSEIFLMTINSGKCHLTGRGLYLARLK